MKYKIVLTKPYITDEERKEADKCIQSSWISSQSPWVGRFEALYAKKVSHTKYAAAVNSGTSALFLSLKALGIGPGDEVILPTFTMIATINAVVWAGATPVLVDSKSKDDWNMSILELEKSITPRTKAIMPVHIYGYVCDMDLINAIARKHKLHVIEDAAEAMGSEYLGKRAGSLSTISCFSLYANKIITTGNGGMVCTDSKRLYKIVKKLAFFDFNEDTHFKHLLFGYNLVLSGIQCALGVAQIKKFKASLTQRRLIYKWYLNNLKNNSEIQIMPRPKNQNPNYWFPAIMFKSSKLKKKTMKLFEDNQIEVRDFFIPAHQQPLYKNIFNVKGYPIADYFAEHGLLLPSYYGMRENELRTIISILHSVI